MSLPESAKSKLSPWFSREELDAFAYTERSPVSWVFRHLFKQGAVTWNGVVNFARRRYDPESASGVSLIAHELLHARQQRATGWVRYLLKYAWLLRRAGYRGRNNRRHPLEQPAYALEEEVVEALRGG